LKALDRSRCDWAVVTIGRAGLESELAELSLQRANPFDPLGGRLCRDLRWSGLR
jgi:hypothetical protein